MKNIRLLGAVVFLYGLTYLLHALSQILGSVSFGYASAIHVHVIGLNLFVGSVSTILGIGLLLIPKWARIAWLGIVTLLVFEHCLVLFLWYIRGGQNLTAQAFNVVLTTCLALFSWTLLTNKKHFGRPDLTA
jgi:hypothetical protein